MKKEEGKQKDTFYSDVQVNLKNTPLFWLDSKATEIDPLMLSVIRGSEITL